MKLPADDAIIDRDKLREYVLAHEHPDGWSKARYLGGLGYVRDNWQRLEADLRRQILTLEAESLDESSWGVKYEILGLLTGPNGRTGGIRSIWIVRRGETQPRLVTLIPWSEP